MKKYKFVYKFLFICFVLLHPTKMDAITIGGINYIYNSNTKTATVTYLSGGPSHFGWNKEKSMKEISSFLRP